MILQTGGDRDRAGQNAEGNRDRDEPQCSSDLAPAVICDVRWPIALHVTRLLTFDWPQTVAQVAGLTDCASLIPAGCNAKGVGSAFGSDFRRERSLPTPSRHE